MSREGWLCFMSLHRQGLAWVLPKKESLEDSKETQTLHSADPPEESSLGLTAASTLKTVLVLPGGMCFSLWFLSSWSLPVCFDVRGPLSLAPKAQLSDRAPHG